ncbi:MAG: DNA-protecting protein DprA [Candidatus Nanopelagicaceae bacterium]|nr:DNA-protecting protein DprA [Candidatus Nanopelagicaceae bacterium]
MRRILASDQEWPQQLNLLEVPPAQLFIESSEPDLSVLTANSIAIVGSRNATPYGLRVAADFAAALAESGYTIISGGAFGIDAAAHRGALSVGGKTVVVLAGGVDCPYPIAHSNLFADASRNGALVSEHPAGTPSRKHNFLERNRIIAGLAVGTLIVEAAYKSGAIRTALDTVKLFRPVMAIPGPISSPLSAGVNRLIAERVAELVVSPWQIAEIVGPYGQDGQLMLDSDGMIKPCQTQSNQPQIFGQGLSLL